MPNTPLKLSDYVPMSKPQVVQHVQERTTEVETTLNQNINSVQTTLSNDINTVNTNLSTQIGQVDTNFTNYASANVFEQGSANYAGFSSEITIPHSLGVTPSFVGVDPANDIGGNLGEVWTRADENNIYIGNTGSFVGSFKYIIRK